MSINKKFVVIVAGGSGKRMNSELPKQFLLINKIPILIHTINSFFLYDKQINIVLVLPKNQIPFWKELCLQHNFTVKHTIAEGGKTRFHSVKNGLDEITEEGFIAIHDGVRPFIKKNIIQNCFEFAEKYGNAAPSINPVDSIRIVTKNENKHIDRSSIKLIQTPQVFDSKIIKKAYKQTFSTEFTDDLSVVEKIGVKINLIEGSKENIKITTPSDIIIAEAIIKGMHNE